jgi:redox-sensitive bicupin YhaK (pirin superfamily)
MTNKQVQNTQRSIARVIKGVPATDGAGVELTRVIGQPALSMLDPFLLLDAFRSDKPEDYIAGFPSHPHRGFETVTYLPRATRELLRRVVFNG